MNKPWYRQFWVWFVLAPLIGTVAASAVTLYLAGAPPALVVDDFGPIAMAVERDQQRLRRAAELGLTAHLEFAAAPAESRQPVTVHLSGAAPPSLTLDLVHPTNAQLDRHAVLKRDGNGYRGLIARADTRLYLHLGDDAGEWRLTGTLDRARSTVDLAAKP